MTERGEALVRHYMSDLREASPDNVSLLIKEDENRMWRDIRRGTDEESNEARGIPIPEEAAGFGQLKSEPPTEEGDYDG